MSRNSKEQAKGRRTKVGTLTKEREKSKKKGKGRVKKGLVGAGALFPKTYQLQKETKLKR